MILNMLMVMKSLNLPCRILIKMGFRAKGVFLMLFLLLFCSLAKKSLKTFRQMHVVKQCLPLCEGGEKSPFHSPALLSCRFCKTERVGGVMRCFFQFLVNTHKEVVTNETVPLFWRNTVCRLLPKYPDELGLC